MTIMPAIINVVNLRFFTTELHGVARSFKTISVFSSVKLRVLRGSILLLMFLALSCKSAPKTMLTMPDETSSIPLDSGALGYLFIDVKNSRPILQYISFNGMDDKQFQQMLDSTQFAAAALYSPLSPRRYQLVAWGDYPSSRAKMALGASKDWKKNLSASGDSYWYSEQQRLSIAINQKQAAVLAVRKNSADASLNVSTDNIPTDPFFTAPGVTAPKGFGEISKEAVLSGWFDSPGPVINQKLQSFGVPFELPAERLFISLFPLNEEQQKEQRYQARLNIQLANDRQARALLTVFTLARNFLGPQTDSENLAALASILFANPPTLEGKTLNITTAALTGKELALLLKMFSL